MTTLLWDWYLSHLSKWPPNLICFPSIVRYNRIARKREVLKGTAVHRTPTSKNGNVNNYRRSASPIMPIEGVNGATTNGQFLTVANAQSTGENISPTTLSVTQVSLKGKIYSAAHNKWSLRDIYLNL